MAFVEKLAYEASAGSGKTFNLVVRYLSLLFMGANANKILALTFTNKAAAEMQERVVKTLIELETRGEFAVICEVTGLSAEAILEKKEAILQSFLASDVKIYTIDKFFAKILRKFSMHVGLMPDFTSYASQHELKLMVRFLNEVSVANKERSLIKLSLMSSKRLSDIFSLLEQLYLKSKELQNRTFQAMDYKIYEAEAFAALGQLQSLIHNCKAASDTAKRVLEIEDFDTLLKATWLQKESCEEYRYFKKCFTPEMNSALYAMQEAILKRIRAYEEHFFYELMQLLDIYIHAKEMIAKDEGELSFSDITALVYKLLKEENAIESDFLYFRLDSEIEHILLDEFQDTSILQYEILAPLMDEVSAGKGVSENRSLFFVGDVKQSIYRFRGGVSALFSHVAQKYDVQVEPLVTNYRSDKAVVDFVNQTFESRIKNYIPQKVKEGAKQGYVEVLNSDEVLESMYKKVAHLLSLQAESNSIAILCVTNADGSSVAEYLSLQGIEVVTETSAKLIEQKKVKALIEYFKYCYFKETIYKRNFFALLAQEEQSLLCLDIEHNSLLKIASVIIDKYALFDGDMNVIKFLSLLRNYKDIESFLFEYERIDEVAVGSDLSGVRILTIHKSKGLEFEHVVVIDRLKNPPADRSALIYEYNDIYLQHIYLRVKNRAFFDKAYENALQKEAQLNLEDKLNALYVAFTRAESSLFIIQKSKQSYFDTVDLTMQSRGLLHIEKQEHFTLATMEKLPFKNLYYGTQSNLLQAEKVEDESSDAIEYGLAMHYMLEMLYDFNVQYLQSAYQAMHNRFASKLDALSCESILKRVTMLLRNQEFLALIADGVVHKEQGITFEGELRYLDVYVQKDKGSDVIIDYKSSQTFQSKHYKQVGFYKYALEQMQAKSVDAYLVYLLDNEIKIEKV